MDSFLEKILAFKEKQVKEKKKVLPLDKLKERLKKAPSPRNFEKEVFSKKRRSSIIAEIKRFSPSRGILRGDLDPISLARVYQENGASAISVLIDRKFFGGSLSYLSSIREITFLPLLAKEFIIDEYQILEARVSGADAVLLIARILDEKRLFNLYKLAGDLQMSCIIEVHSPCDVEKISCLPSRLIVGINNRNLENFQVNLNTTEEILSLLPSSYLVISESGIKDLEDIKFLKKRGIKAFLVGEAILRSEDPAKKLKELCNG